MAAWSTESCRDSEQMSVGRMIIVRRSDWASGRSRPRPRRAQAVGPGLLSEDRTTCHAGRSFRARTGAEGKLRTADAQCRSGPSRSLPSRHGIPEPLQRAGVQPLDGVVPPVRLGWSAVSALVPAGALGLSPQRPAAWLLDYQGCR